MFKEFTTKCSFSVFVQMILLNNKHQQKLNYIWNLNWFFQLTRILMNIDEYIINNVHIDWIKQKCILISSSKQL
jgi:hypothetical protein